MTIDLGGGVKPKNQKPRETFRDFNIQEESKTVFPNCKFNWH